MKNKLIIEKIWIFLKVPQDGFIVQDNIEEGAYWLGSQRCGRKAITVAPCVMGNINNTFFGKVGHPNIEGNLTGNASYPMDGLHMGYGPTPD